MPDDLLARYSSHQLLEVEAEFRLRDQEEKERRKKEIVKQQTEKSPA